MKIHFDKQLTFFYVQKCIKVKDGTLFPCIHLYTFLWALFQATFPDSIGRRHFPLNGNSAHRSKILAYKGIISTLPILLTSVSNCLTKERRHQL
uniref:Uncharacterized protein n=1 Tax=Anguilla anguilla TaxID=7936 RepID=A0A0E9X4R4_ANGAN